MKNVKTTALARPTRPTPKPKLIVCNGRLEASVLYQGLLDALRENVGELNIVVEANGKQHFTSCPITNVFDLLRKYSKALAEDFNKQMGSVIDAN